MVETGAEVAAVVVVGVPANPARFPVAEDAVVAAGLSISIPLFEFPKLSLFSSRSPSDSKRRRAKSDV